MRPDLADLIDGAIGEGSPFHERFGYYAQGVGPDTAVLPIGWESRMVKIQGIGTDLKIGWRLEPTDLAASKLAAGREKDWGFVAHLLSLKIVDATTLKVRISEMNLAHDRRDSLFRWIDGRSDPSAGNALGNTPPMRP